jgi:CRISPR-associated endoribonuclease Cas6
MLLSVVLHLVADKAATLPYHLGRANQSEFLSWVRAADPRIATYLHDQNAPPHFTCSSLVGPDPGSDSRSIRPQQTYSVRFTSLDRDVSLFLEELFHHNPPLRWTLHGHTFRVTAICADPQVHGWSGYTSFEELAARYLLDEAGPLRRRITLDFASPTAFKSGGVHVPVPMPGLVFGSLLDRWNACSPISLPDDVRAYAEECVAISRYHLQSAPVKNKQGSVIIGGAGQVTYSILEEDAYGLAALHLLADFALFSGVGVKTTSGMGQARRVMT